jgi:hypothetical protein
MSAPMSKDEARKLLGGYATGSLSEAERKALFQAALEDQELFDELAGEQVLKEVLDEPGARQRLVAALEPPRRHRAWIWGWAGAAATVAVVIGVVILQRTQPPPQQIAQVLKSQEPAPAAPTATAPTRPQTLRKVSPPTPSPSAEAPAELKKEEALADRVQEAQPQAAAGALREFASSVPRLVFSFSYSVTADGYLEITPSVSGFLSVTSSDAVVFSSSLVGVSTLRFAIPSDATSLVIAFSRTEGITGTPVRRDALAGRETDQDPPNGRILIQLFLTPATR